jgi:HK97 gp10 family phage protein
MKIGLESQGLAELARTLNALSQAVRRRRLYALLRPAAEPMRARMSELAPRHAPAPDLADNIGISPALKLPSASGGDSERADEFQAAIAVGPTKGFYYGLFLEYGTVRQSAHAFMRPAFDSSAEDSLAIIRRGLWDLMLDVIPESAGSTTPSAGGTGLL